MKPVSMLLQLSVCLGLYFLVFANQVVMSAHLVRSFAHKNARQVVEGNLADVVRFLMRSMLLIVVCHIFNVALWAVAYLAVGVADDFHAAFVVSLANYTTLGAPDADWPKNWNLIPPFEALCGIIMFAWSISLFYSMHEFIVKSRYAEHKLK